jgi:hypothetical protein
VKFVRKKLNFDGLLTSMILKTRRSCGFLGFLILVISAFGCIQLYKLTIFRRIRRLRTATISIVMSVCPSVSPFVRKNSAPIGRIIMKFDICGFKKPVKKFQV